MALAGVFTRYLKYDFNSCFLSGSSKKPFLMEYIIKSCLHLELNEYECISVCMLNGSIITLLQQMIVV